MALPADGASWPPGEGTTHGDNVREWSAWYSGDPAQLGAYYSPLTGRPNTTRPSQYAGGVVGKFARWWWGTPASDGEQQAKLHVPLAADIAGTSADLLFSEPVRLTSDDKTTQQLLDTLQDEGLDARLHEGGEVQAALGGVFLRNQWDKQVQPTPWTTIVHPDGAVPEWRNGKLVAVNLWTQLPGVEQGVVHRHIERHELGYIVHRLYAGTLTNLGRTVPLQDHPLTADLAGDVNELGAVPTGLQQLTVQYAPNMLPNRADRHSLQGRSDFQGVTPLFDALDEAYSSWWRDIRHAKSRLHVPESYLDSMGPGEGAVADVDRELYVPVRTIGSQAGELQVVATQFKIRVAEHAQTCKEWTERAIESAGYSTQSLSSGTGGAVTATEVHAHERRSYMTRGKKVRYWRAALRDHLRVQVELARQLGAGPGAGDVDVDFRDGVQDSVVQLGQTAQLLRNAEAASVQTRVQLVHPDWDKLQVDEEVERIMRETGAGEPVASPDDAGF